MWYAHLRKRGLLPKKSYWYEPRHVDPRVDKLGDHTYIQMNMASHKQDLTSWDVSSGRLSGLMVQRIVSAS